MRERHECPSCRTQAEEMHLTKNVAVEELSMKWKVSRFVLKRTHAIFYTLINA